MLHTVAHVNTKKLSDADKEAGIIRAVIGSSEVLDRAGDIIRQDGWDLKNFMKNRVILWGHNVRQDRPPIGKAIKIWLDGKTSKTKKLMFDIQFDLKDSFAADIYRKVLEGFVNTVSVGFIPLEREDNVFTKNELLELSFVPVPANPEAVVTLRGMGLEPVELKDMYSAKSDDEVAVLLDEEEGDTEDDEESTEETTTDTKEEENTETDTTQESTEAEEETEEESTDEETKEEVTEEESTDEESTESEEETNEDESETEETDEEKALEAEETKGIIPYTSHGVAPESEEWDGAGEMAKAELSDLKVICAYYNTDKAESKDAYLLPHHRVSDKKAVWRGVASAMGALLGAKGGVELAPRAKKAVYKHLAKHYEEFGKPVPDYKMVEEQVLASLSEEVHAITLDREDKYAVRLLKKLLKQTKPEKQVKTDVNIVDEEKAVEALKVIDQALTAVLSKTRVGKE